MGSLDTLATRLESMGDQFLTASGPELARLRAEMHEVFRAVDEALEEQPFRGISDRPAGQPKAPLRKRYDRIKRLAAELAEAAAELP